MPSLYQATLSSMQIHCNLIAIYYKPVLKKIKSVLHYNIITVHRHTVRTRRIWLANFNMSSLNMTKFEPKYFCIVFQLGFWSSLKMPIIFLFTCSKAASYTVNYLQTILFGFLRKSVDPSTKLSKVDHICFLKILELWCFQRNKVLVITLISRNFFMIRIKWSPFKN